MSTHGPKVKESQMSKTLTLRQMVDMASDNAERNMREHGEIHQIWHAQMRNGETMVLSTVLETKDQTAEAVRKVFAEADAVRCVSTHESWYLEPLGETEYRQLQKDYYAKGKSMADHPKRKEGVAIFAEDEDGNFITAMRSIIRGRNGDPDSKPILGPLKILETTRLEGRLVGMLPPRGTKQ
jgi:hypothetical protein